MQKFIEYKAEGLGKTVIYADPKYTSQKCFKCGYFDENNRHGSVFRCLNCNFELNADLNTSRNIEVLDRPEYLLLSTSQSLSFDETMLTCMAEDINKLNSLWMSS